MNDISLVSILSLWSDLADAYWGKACHGDTAEIYAYRFWQYAPTLDSPGGFKMGCDARFKAIADRHSQAVNSLLDLLEHFAKERQCSIVIDGEPMSGWHRTNWDFSHRAKIRVAPKE